MTDIEKKARNIVAEHLGIADALVREEARFIDDLGADSLDTVELVMCFENEFSIEIDDARMEDMQTFGDAVRMITEQVAPKSTAA